MNGTRWFSLRRHLLTLLLSGVTIGWLLTMVATYFDTQHEVDELIAEHAVNYPDTDEAREELTEHLTARLVYPAVLGLPVLALWVWLAIRSGLRPLEDIAREIARREPGRLSALTPDEAPEEIRPLLDSLNHLFARVERTIQSEKRFTADAAHELRTPLAALITQAQVARRARDSEEQHHAIDQLIAGSRRLAHLVDQMLTLARVDPDTPPPAHCVDLAALAQDVCAAHGSLAMEAGVNLELDAAPTTVGGDPHLLRVLLRNLIDNAIRYTPPGGDVLVTTHKRTLTVSDTGPGIPASERERVFDRFLRLAGQETEGSGLGLSIVARIAELHGAQIRLNDGQAGCGLTVSIEFPA